MYNSFFKFFFVSIIILTIYSCFISLTPNYETTIDKTFNWPLPNNYNITCHFGPRKIPTLGASSFHYGIDISAKEGTTIYSCFSGTVTYIGFRRSKWVFYNC